MMANSLPGNNEDVNNADRIMMIVKKWWSRCYDVDNDDRYDYYYT